MTRRFSNLVCLCAFLSGSLLHAQTLNPANDRAEQRFLQQLLDRRLLELAERHCQNRIEQLLLPDEKAAWQLRLSVVREQHAWAVDSEGRGGLINLAIEEITSLKPEKPVSAENQFRLRLRQAQLLRSGIRMSLIAGEGGQLFGPPRYRAERADAQIVLPQSAIAGEKMLQRAAGIVEALQKQLESLRSDLDVRLVRRLRSQLRLESVEIACLKVYVQSVGGVTAFDTADLAEEIEASAKSAASPAEKFQASWLHAELALNVNDLKKARLHIQAAAALEKRLEPSALPLRRTWMLEARRLLREQQATKALQLLENSPATSVLTAQQRQWLLLECQLGLFEFGDQLKDAALKARAAGDFELLRAQLQTEGVYAHAAQQTQARFDLIRTVGRGVANEFEQLERLRHRGKTAEALTLASTMVQRLPANSGLRAKAALRFEIGRMLLEAKRWADAEKAFQQAAQEFGRLEDVDRQSQADLLKIFALARQLALPESNRSLAEYLAAIESHLEQFKTAATAGTARNWLLQAKSAADPGYAARLAWQQFQAESHPQKQLKLMHDFGRLLVAVPRHESDSVRGLAASFHTELRAMEQRESIAKSELAVLKLFALQLRIRSSTEPDWERIPFEIADVFSDLKEAGKLTTELEHDVRVLRWIVAGRTYTQPDTQIELSLQLKELGDKRVVATVNELASYMQGDAGDNNARWLATAVSPLLDRYRRSAIQQSFGLQLQSLKSLKALGRVLQDSAEADDFLRSMLQQSLTEKQIREIARLLSDAADNDTAAGPVDFWASILKSENRGSDLWLEAHLQLAAAAQRLGNSADAAKRLNVVDTLYPDWGNEARKLRASNLAEQVSP